MLDLEKGSEQLDKADGFLTKLKTLLKKHWGILTFLGLCAFVYWAFNLPEVKEEHISDTPTHGHRIVDTSYVITKETYFIDDYGYREGDTVYEDYYSDGYVERYYTDNEEYIDN